MGILCMCRGIVCTQTFQVPYRQKSLPKDISQYNSQFIIVFCHVHVYHKLKQQIVKSKPFYRCPVLGYGELNLSTNWLINPSISYLIMKRKK